MTYSTRSDMKKLIKGLQEMRRRSLLGALDGIQAICDLASEDMSQDPAHGDDTEASHANYAASAFGAGRSTEDDAAAQLSVAEALNPGRAALLPFTVPDGALGAVYSSAMSYARYLEGERDGDHAVITPTFERDVRELTSAAAEGSRRALT